MSINYVLPGSVLIGTAVSTGAIGPQGSPGVTGAQGIQGSPGVTGIQGPTGSIGLQGNQGSPGVTGANGANGSQGSPGVTGTQGPTGSMGLQGIQGSPGVTGNTGPAGIQGSPGVTGAMGPTGSIGPGGNQGSPGVTGSQGIQGVQGSPGATGTQGPTGSIGPDGNQGNQGSPGATGAAGVPGATGPAGAQGATGAQGPTGAMALAVIPSLIYHESAVAEPLNQTVVTGGAQPWATRNQIVYVGTAGYFRVEGNTGAGNADLIMVHYGSNPLSDGQANGPAVMIPAGLAVTGVAGSQGATGPAGANGAQGATGPAGNSVAGNACIALACSSGAALNVAGSVYTLRPTGSSVITWTTEVYKTGNISHTTIGTAAGSVSFDRAGTFNVAYQINYTGISSGVNIAIMQRLNSNGTVTPIALSVSYPIISAGFFAGAAPQRISHKASAQCDYILSVPSGSKLETLTYLYPKNDGGVGQGIYTGACAAICITGTSLSISQLA